MKAGIEGSTLGKDPLAVPRYRFNLTNLWIVVVLSLESSFFVGPQLHQDRRHVVCADALAAAEVFGAALVEQAGKTLTQLLQILLLGLRAKIIVVNLFMHPAYNLLAAFDVPDAVTRKHDELAVRRELLGLHFWERCDLLFFGSKLRTLLVFKVSERPRKSEHPVDAVLLDISIGVVDAPLLVRQRWFVINRQINSLFAFGQHSARIPRVCAINFSWCDQDYSGCTA